MAQNDKHIRKEDFIRYLSDKMSASERNRFERLLEQHPFEAEALEGIQSIGPENISADLNDLRDKIQEKKRANWVWYRAAAAILIVLVTSSIFIVLNKKQSPIVEITENKTEVIPEKESVPTKMEEPEDNLIQDSFKSDSDENTEILVSESAVASKELQSSDEINIIENEVEEQTGISTTSADFEMTETTGFAESKGEARIALQHVADGIKVEKSKKAAVPAVPDENISSQTKYIAGVVLSAEDSTPIPGASVMAKGTNMGVISDLEGNFNLPLPADSNYTILASFVGMENVEISNLSDSENIIYMKTNDLALNEVVVTEYTKGNQQSKVPIATRAEPVPGYKEFNNYLRENCIIPEGYIPEKKVVQIELTIDKSGKIINIEPKNSPDSLLFKNAIRIINDGPEWKPGESNENVVESLVLLRLRFRK